MRIGLAIVVLLLLGASWFVVLGQEEEVQVKETSSYVTTLDVEYDEGVYEIEGTVEVENRCTAVSGEAAYNAGVVTVSVQTNPYDGVCLTLPTERSFSYTVEGEEGAVVEFFVNDTYITL